MLLVHDGPCACLDSLHQVKERSASALEIGCVHPIRRRQWILRNESLSQAPSAWRRLFGIVCSLLPFNFCVFHSPSHCLTSLGRDFGKISLFNRFSKIFTGCVDVVTCIDGTRLKRQHVWCVSTRNCSSICPQRQTINGMATVLL